MAKDIRKSNEDLKVFLHPDFDADVFSADILEKQNEQINSTLHETSTVELCVTSLNSHLKRIDDSITNLVEQNQGPMMERMSRVGDLKRRLETVMSGARNLRLSMERIRSDVMVPFDQIKQRVVQLRRMQSASNLLRHIMRLLFVVGKLRSQMSNLEVVAAQKVPSSSSSPGSIEIRELISAAQSLRDVDLIMRIGDLDGIDVVAAEIKWVKQARERIRLTAERLLREGMRTLNQAVVGSALQVFFTLSQLDGCVKDAVVRSGSEFRTRCVELLDMSSVGNEARHGSKPSGGLSSRSPGRVSGKQNPSSGEAAAWRVVIWRRVSRLAEAIYASTLQVWTLYRVAIKKRDPKTRKRFVEHLDDENGARALDVNSALRSFWLHITGTIAQQLKRSSEKSQFFRSVLVGEYPRARELLSALLKRLQNHTSKGSAADRKSAMRASSSSDPFKNIPTPIMCTTDADKDTLLGSLANFLEIYLARSIARLNEPLTFMWPVPEHSTAAHRRQRHPYRSDDEIMPLPTASDVTTFSRVIERELQAARRDLGLLMAIARGAVTSVVRQFAARAESAVAPAYSDPWILQSKGSATSSVRLSAGQQRNATIVSRLQQLRSVLERMIEATVDQNILARALKPAVENLDDLSRQILAPYIISAAKQLEFVIVDMHKETFDIKNASGTTSLFMKRLQSFLGRLAQFLESVLDCRVRQELSDLLVGRVVVLFVRHASLLRPLSEAGKLRMTQDMAQLELAIGPIVKKVSRLGWIYEELRAFRQLLFLETQAVGQLPRHELVKMRPSTIAHHLISRAPMELQHPFESEKDAAGYSNWMETVARKVREKSLRDETFDGQADIAVGCITKTPGTAGSLDALRILARVHELPSLEVESKVWIRVQRSVDAYAQRVSGDETKKLCAEYGALNAICPVSIRCFRAHCNTSAP
eukprot:g382.t1